MLSAVSMQAQNYTDAGYIKQYFDGTTETDFGEYISLGTIDIDNDGDLDLYLGRDNGIIEIYTNDGNGNFTANGTFQADGIELNTGSYASPEFADFDNDGDLDLLSGNYSGEVLLFNNDGSGNFSQMPKIQADGIDIQEGSQSALQVIDIDNDGDLDLLVGNYFGTVHLYEMITLSSITAQPTSLARHGLFK